MFKRLAIIGMILPLAACMGKLTDTAMSRAGLAEGMPETRTLAQPLPPVPSASRTGLKTMQVRNLLDGRTETIRVSRYGNGIRAREPGGCVWTRDKDWFSPSDSFANCSSSKDWKTAQATVRRIESIYPLTVGSTGTYSRRAVSATGKVSTRETRCEVIDQVAVVVPGQADVPAYVVECNDGRITRTTWFSPDRGPVAYREVHEKRGVRDAWLRLG